MAQLALGAFVVLVGLYDLNDAGHLAASGLYLTFLRGSVGLRRSVATLEAGEGGERHRA